MGKFCDEKQQMMLDSFYGEMKTWSPESYGYRIGSWVCIVLMVIFFCLPYQEIQGDDDIRFFLIYLCLLGGMGATFYVRQYIRFNENRKETKLSGKLKYLPVSLNEVRLYCIRKILKFQSRLLVIVMVGQITFTCVLGFDLELVNFLYPIVLGFGVPIVAVVLELAAVK